MAKRITSLLITLLLIVSSAQGLAQSYQPETEKASFLNVLGIELPADEVDTKDTQRPIKKAEFVYLVIRAMGRNIQLNKEYLTFPDVKLDSWYHDNVISAAAKGIVSCRQDGYFGVDDELTVPAGALIMLKALGFDTLPDAGTNDELISNYSRVYKELIKGVSGSGVITLADAYTMVYNMLLSDYVSWDFSSGHISYNIEKNTHYMQDAFDVNKYTGRVTGNEYTSLGIDGAGAHKEQIEIDGVCYRTVISDVTDYLGYEVDYYVDESETGDPVVLYVIPKERNTVTEIASADIISCEVSGGRIIIKYEDEVNREKRLYVPITCDFVYNRKVTGFTAELITDLIENKLGSVKLIEYGDRSLLSVTAYDTLIVDTVSAYDEKIFGRYGAAAVSIAESSSNFISVEKDGVLCTPYEIKKDDVIQIASSLDGEYKEIVVCSFTLTGAVDRVAANNIVIDGVEYPLSNYFIRHRQNEADIRLGLKQKFLFNAGGEVVDVMKDSAEHTGEYAFLISVRNVGDLPDDHKVRIKYVTMNANMKTAYLTEKVKYNGSRAWSDNIVNSFQAAENEVIYIEGNDEGLISVINTSDQKNANGVFTRDDIMTKGADEKKRKCKQQSAWLEDTNDANFPEFYTDQDTKILMVPTTSSDKEYFDEEYNYEVKSQSYFQDAKDYIVEAYNLDDYNVAGIMLLRQEQTFDTRMSNNGLMIVTAINRTLNEDGEDVPLIEGYQSGEKVSVKLKDDDVMYYFNKPANTPIKKNDVVRFNINNKGYAIHSEYIKNLENDCDITDYPEGRNDGNAIVVGKVVSQKNNYLRLEFTSAASVRERVFRGTVTDVTVYDDGKCYKGNVDEIAEGSLVIIRVFYTTLKDVIIVK